MKYFDLDVYGLAFYGHDPFPGFLQDLITPAGPTSHYGFFVQADYTWKPWIMSFVRYEQVWVSGGLAKPGPNGNTGDEGRIVPGITLAIRQNLRLSSEVYIDTRGIQPPDSGLPEATFQWITSVQWAF